MSRFPELVEGRRAERGGGLDRRREAQVKQRVGAPLVFAVSPADDGNSPAGVEVDGRRILIVDIDLGDAEHPDRVVQEG